MKHSMKIFAAVLSLLISVCANAADEGIERLHAVEEKVRTVDLKDVTQKAELLDAAASAVEKMPTGPKMKLDANQVKELVELLKQTDEIDFFHKVVEHNSELFQKNKHAIEAQVKKLPPKNAKAIRDTIDIVLSEDEATDQ